MFSLKDTTNAGPFLGGESTMAPPSGVLLLEVQEASTSGNAPSLPPS